MTLTYHQKQAEAKTKQIPKAALSQFQEKRIHSVTIVNKTTNSLKALLFNGNYTDLLVSLAVRS